MVGGNDDCLIVRSLDAALFIDIEFDSMLRTLRPNSYDKIIALAVSIPFLLC